MIKSMKKNECNIGSVNFGGGQLAVICGPCMAESLELCLEVAGVLDETCRKLGIGYIFKASYDKANRSSIDSYRGPGINLGLEWLAQVKRDVSVPVLTDIHEVSHAAVAAKVVDCLQIPAFLCRQSDLLTAAGETGIAVNIKKGQFMAPWDMAHAVRKVQSTGNSSVMLTERGTSFGYNRLITDFRSVVRMQEFAPVVFDATHSIQEPGGLGHASSGEREFAPVLAKAAMAAGADGLFIETHPNPQKAKSDAACQIPLSDMPNLLESCLKVFEAAKP